MDPFTWFYIAIMVISAGVSYAQSKKAQQEAKKARDAAGGVLINRQGTVEQIPVVYGTRRVGGVRVYATSKEGVGSLKNDTIYVCLVLCEGPVESITDFYINGEPYAGSKYQTGGYCTFTTYLGTDGQTADPTLVALNDGWTTDHKLSGLAYIVFSAGMSSDIKENPWTGGLPEITALVTGRLVFDPRDSSTAWSDNAALIIRDYLTNARYGKGLSSDAIDDTLFSAAATILDAASATTDAPPAENLGVITGIDIYQIPLVMTFSGDQTAKLTYSGTIQNSGATMTGFVVGPPFYNAANDTTLVYFFPTLGVFTIGTTVLTAAVAVDRSPFGCHAVLDTEDTLFDNLNKLIMGCRGFIPYSNGKYGLILDGAGSSVMSFGLDTIVGGIELQGTEKKDKFNQMIVTFPNPELAYQPDQIIYPVPDGVEDTALLAIDGERMSDTFEVETLASRSAAYNMAKILLIRSRYNNRVTFNSTSEGFNVVVGDVIDITHSSFGWSGELFKVESVALNYDGTCGIAARQYIADAYDLDSVPTRPFWGNPTFPDSSTAQPPTSLVLVETTTIANDGSVIPALSVAWTAALDSFVTRYEVQWKKSTDTDYNSVLVAGVQTRLTGLETGVTYNVQVRSLNGFGSYSEWLTGSEVIDGDTTAPGVVSSLTATASYGSIYLKWTNPTDYDFWQALIYVNTVDTFGTATLLASIAGDAFVHSGLGGGVTRYYWVVARDGTGNVSAQVGSVTATTLSLGGVTTYYQTTAPGSPVTGDLWFDTDDDNAAYRWNGSSWDSVDSSVIADFNIQNNRNTTAVTAPNFTFSPSQSAFAVAMPDDETYADLLFNWLWGGTEGEIDGFHVFLYASTSASAYTFGTTPYLETMFTVPADTRAMIFYGLRASRYYTVGVRAYRRVDADLDSDGVIVSSVVKSTYGSDNPFRINAATPISNIYTEVYDTTRRIASVAVSTGISLMLDNMADDGVLTPVEKLSLLKEWETITTEYNEILTMASAVGVSTTALTVDYDALGTYLNDGSAWSPGSATPLWLNGELALSQTITAATFRAKWTDYYDEYATLSTSINNVNVNPGNPIDGGNIDDLIDPAIITNTEDSYNVSPQSGGGISTFYTLAAITVPILSYATKINLQWNLLQDYSADVDFHLKITRQVDAAAKTTLGDSSVISERCPLPAGQIVDVPPTSGTNVVYRVEWAGASSSVTCVARLVLVYLRR